MVLPLSCFVCGLARDCEDALDKSLRSVERLQGDFGSLDLVVVTNDSVDATAEILTQWAAVRNWATVLRFDGLASAMPARTDRLAVLRNACLREFWRRMEAGRNFDLMIVLDFDGVNENLTVGKTFGDLFSAVPSDWGGIFANQRQAYYDVWALRHSRWCPDDCWQRVRRSTRFRFVPKSLRRRLRWAAVERYVGRRQIKIDPRHGPIEVDSAFGGFGIYKTRFLRNAWYSGRDSSGQEVCEHVWFNSCVRNSGGKLYIMPSLLNDADPEHLAPGSGKAEQPWLCPSNRRS
jgi:glycosyltransferase involved in cell wall biosynthesis